MPLDSVMGLLQDRKFFILSAVTSLIVVCGVNCCYSAFFPAQGDAPPPSGRKSLLSYFFSSLCDTLTLTPMERKLTADFLPHQVLSTDFAGIGGLTEEINEIKRLIINPLKRPHLYSHTKLFEGGCGILLVGPPGTGKTMLARAVAGSSQFNFINVNSATIESKFAGDGPKLVQAIFSLAQKKAPCVVFVDEADALFGKRSNSDQDHVISLKTTFMKCVDGFIERKEKIVLMGCTNRPEAIDPAMMRRMPHKIMVRLPGIEGRKEILRVHLDRERISQNMDFQQCAEATEGFSGCDLRNLLRSAMSKVIAETFKEEEKLGAEAGQLVPRELNHGDILSSLLALPPITSYGR